MSAITPERRLRLAGLIAAVALVAGCEAPPKAPPVVAPAPPPVVIEAPPPPPPPPPAPTPAGPAAQQQAQKAAIAAAEQFELGNEEAARAELKRALGLDFQNKLALNLTRQLSVDPVATLGRDSFNYTVRPGETLSRIAGRFLNDLYAFVILARYNNIAVPKLVSAGQVLKIPGKQRAGTSPPAASTPSSAVAMPPPKREPPMVTSDADRTSAPKPPPPAAPPPPPELSAGEKAMRSAQAAERTGDLATARLAYINAASLGESAAAPKVEQTTRALVQRYSVAARGALARQDLDGSIASWQRVLDIDPANGTARSEIERMRALKAKLGSVK